MTTPKPKRDILVSKWKMNNGLEIPALALGTFVGIDVKVNNLEQGKSEPTCDLRDIISAAIDVGYRHFDTAAVYGTEPEISLGLRKHEDLQREDLFITTKVWNTQHRRSEVVESLKSSLMRLGMDYVDLYLIHWPIGLNADYSFTDTDYMETWRGMEDCIRMGLTKSIGVSNFNKTQLKRLIKEAHVKPAVLQIEVHLQIVQNDLVTYAQSEGLVVMGFCPFGSLVSRRGQDDDHSPKIDNPVLCEIARKYNKTTLQILLRWLIERRIIPIPKTQKLKRLEQNIDVFDFQLTPQEVEKISAFDCGKRFSKPSFWQDHPDYPFEMVPKPSRNPFLH